MFFRRNQNIVTKPEDAGAKIVNRILTLGLLAFIAFTALSEKRTLDKTIYKWNVAATNNISGTKENIIISENSEINLTLNAEDIKKISQKNATDAGNLTVYTLKFVLQPVKPTATP